MGKCKVELAITLNTGDFNNVKATVGFEETYTDDDEKVDHRDKKFQELLEVCNDKLDDAVLTAVKKIKQIKK